MPSTAQAIAKELATLVDPERAETMTWFMQARPGGYGEGDRFLGIRVPELRRVARQHRDASLDDCRDLLRSPMHEHRFVGLVIMRLRFEGRAADAAERERIAELYLAERRAVNNWDLVDASAPYVLADRVRTSPRELLDPLLGSDRVWDRRIAVLATFSLIREGRYDETMRAAEALLGDSHDLMHKAVGWMLREVGKRDPATLRGFLDRHASAMPRTMLRYAIERLDADERRRYMSA